MPAAPGSPKEHYRILRRLTCAELWADAVPAFERAAPADRPRLVGILRAVGVVFAESGTPEERQRAREWLRPLLGDPDEKVRRYALAALPKLGADATEEAAVLALLPAAAGPREQRHVARALEKIGGAATLAAAAGTPDPRLARAAQKAAGNVARRDHPGALRLDAPVPPEAVRAVHLHPRSGLEPILADEIREAIARRRFPFRLDHREAGLLILAPTAPFTLQDVLALRTFSSLAFPLGDAPPATADRGRDLAALAHVIADPATERLLRTLTDGPLRYRLEFPGRGHQRHAVRALGDHVYALRPALVNDSRDAPWQIRVPAAGPVVLAPRFRPDPRFAYRRGDVPAASHPPLAAAIARLAGDAPDDVVWDPFCGSGLELIERALRGRVSRLIGTDLSAAALETARTNLAAAALGDVPTHLVVADFRDHPTIPALASGAVTCLVTNPPLGRRVPIRNLRGLVGDLFTAAAEVLRPGGRLVLTNPVTLAPPPAAFRAEFRARVDLGGFTCHLEKYIRR